MDAFLFLEKINTLLPQIIIEENAADIAENDFNFLTSISDKSEIIFLLQVQLENQRQSKNLFIILKKKFKNYIGCGVRI